MCFVNQVRQWMQKSLPSTKAILLYTCVIILVTISYLEIKDTQQFLSLRFPQLWSNDSIVNASPSNLPRCPVVPPNLRGALRVLENVTMEEAEANNNGVERGGKWWPPQCQALWRVAIIVPYRNRSSQIGIFLNHMHKFLQKQELNYTIYIIEQKGNELFNRGCLMNVGYKESRKEGPWDCFAFHDVDLLPENDHHLYHCSTQPRHLTVASSQMNYRLPYNSLFGGACLLTEEHVQKVNGWSNRFWGWGAEDDDMWNRIDAEQMAVWRYPPKIARYKSLMHSPQTQSKERFTILRENRGKHKRDGLTTLKYDLVNITRKVLYTHVLADISFKGI